MFSESLVDIGAFPRASPLVLWNRRGNAKNIQRSLPIHLLMLLEFRSDELFYARSRSEDMSVKRNID